MTDGATNKYQRIELQNKMVPNIQINTVAPVSVNDTLNFIQEPYQNLIENRLHKQNLPPIDTITKESRVEFEGTNNRISAKQKIKNYGEFKKVHRNSHNS